MNLLSAIHRELLARRIGKVLATVPVTVHAKEVADTPNQRHASFAVLRAARLVSVGNWLAHKAQGRLALLEAQLAKDIMAHASGFASAGGVATAVDMTPRLNRIVFAGDFEGHPFRGNQWTDVGGGQWSMEAKLHSETDTTHKINTKYLRGLELEKGDEEAKFVPVTETPEKGKLVVNESGKQKIDDWSKQQHEKDEAGRAEKAALETAKAENEKAGWTKKGGKFTSAGWEKTGETENGMKISSPIHGEHWIPKRGAALDESGNLTVTGRGKDILESKIQERADEATSNKFAAQQDLKTISEGGNPVIQHHADGSQTISGGKIIRETDKAVLYQHPDYEDMWMPKSQVKLDEDKATMPAWLVDKKLITRNVEVDAHIAGETEKAYKLRFDVMRADGEPQDGHIFVPKSLAKVDEHGRVSIPRWLKAQKEEEFIATRGSSNYGQNNQFTFAKPMW